MAGVTETVGAQGRVRAGSGARRTQLTRFATGLKSRIETWAGEENGRLALWGPVALGAGAASYFMLTAEPPYWFAPGCLAVAAAGWALGGALRLFWAAACLAAAGFFVADLRTESVAAPALARELSPRAVTGRLASVEEGPGMRRLVVEVSAIDGVDPGDLPKRVRVTWRGAAFDVLPGERIALRAGLSPPPAPEAPGGFDMRRQLYFQQIGAVGYALTPPQRLDDDVASLAARAQIAVERTRLAVARRIAQAAPGAGGAIVAAFVTGKRAAIPAEAERALQRSGLAHLLAISGFHMGLATGLIFFAVRLGLAAIEPAAQRFPIKKWAAIAALAAGVAYLLLSGGGWSARRAFIMTSIVFVAILFDRRALSLRNVAVAATIILLMTPEAVMHPGFQMSFAAVTALIAAYEWASARADPGRSFALPARLRRYVVGIGVTDTIAATATAPFGLYHFNYAAIYSLPANLAAMPLMAFWIMPVAVAALLLSPLGLDGWAWRAAAEGVEMVLATARAVSTHPGAAAFMPQWPPAALAVISLGGLWFCLQRAPWRIAGLAALPLAALLIAATRSPDIFVSGRAANAAVFAPESKVIAVLEPRRNRFSSRVWMEHAGLDPYASTPLPMTSAGRCDAAGCVVERRGVAVSFLTDPLALAEDCERAGLVVAFFPVSDAHRARCAARLIDRRDLWRDGAHAVWIGRNGSARIRTVAEGGERPWTNPRR